MINYDCIWGGAKFSMMHGANSSNSINYKLVNEDSPRCSLSVALTVLNIIQSVQCCHSNMAFDCGFFILVGLFQYWIDDIGWQSVAVTYWHYLIICTWFELPLQSHFANCPINMTYVFSRTYWWKHSYPLLECKGSP